MYWDDADLPRELVVRPVTANEEGEYRWSGGFPISETEWYFGLRLRRASNPSLAINIPANVTVGSSGGRGGVWWPHGAAAVSALPCFALARFVCVGRVGWFLRGSVWVQDKEPDSMLLLVGCFLPA